MKMENGKRNLLVYACILIAVGAFVGGAIGAFVGYCINTVCDCIYAIQY